MFKISQNFHFIENDKINHKKIFACTLSVYDITGKVDFSPFTKRRDPSSGTTPNNLINYDTGKFSQIIVSRATATQLSNRVNALETRLKTEHNRKIGEIKYDELPDDNETDSLGDGTFV